MNINRQNVQNISRYRGKIGIVYNGTIQLTTKARCMYAAHGFSISITMVAIINMARKNIMQELPWQYTDSKNNYQYQRKRSLYGCIFFQKLKLSCKGRSFFVNSLIKKYQNPISRFFAAKAQSKNKLHILTLCLRAFVASLFISFLN